MIENRTHKFCKKCMESLPVDNFRLIREKKKHRKNICFYLASFCKKCESLRSLANYRKNETERKLARKLYLENTRSDIFYYVKRTISKYKNRTPDDFDLDVNYLVNLYHEQEGKCFYTDEIMLVGGKNHQPRRNFISLDRYNPTKGYVKGNVRWCTYLANTMKSDLTPEEFKDKVTKMLNKF